ncbi:MAG: ParA family protein [Alphaproteobacteria bacterium]|nr:MAG: ParA family protein [Alphaproteobacteria bacterium]
MSTEVIAFVNHKGGVGKTTCVINFGAILAAMGKRVLLVDLDAQGNLSSGLRVPTMSQSIYDCVAKNVDINTIIHRTYLPNIDILPSSMHLSGMDAEAFQNLKPYFDKIEKPYDYILIDCPPSLGVLMVMAIVSSTSIVIPLQCEFFALNGLITLISIIKKVERKFNKSINVRGILPTMLDARSKFSKQMLEKLKSKVHYRICQNMIPRNSKVVESNSMGEPIILYDLNCAAAEAYLQSTKELFFGEYSHSNRASSRGTQSRGDL